MTGTCSQCSWHNFRACRQVADWQKGFCQTHMSWQNTLHTGLKSYFGRGLWTPCVKARLPYELAELWYFRS